MARKSKAEKTAEASAFGSILQIGVTLVVMIAKRGGNAGEDIKWLDTEAGKVTLAKIADFIVTEAKTARQATVKVAKIVLVKSVIDCDAGPFLPEGWKVEEHIKGGQLEWDPDRIELYLAEGQKNGCVKGNELRKLFKGELVMNANVLDYLFAHQELIPKEWKGKWVFFWGTIYSYSDGDLCVRCLCGGDSGWRWDFRWLEGGFGGGDPAVLRQQP